MKHFLLTLALLCLTLSIAGAEQNDFHPPQSKPEILLDHILNHRISAKENIFTKALLQAIDSVEKKLAQQQCGGKAVPGDQCGFGVNPITCSQDANDTYLYKTLEQSADKAVIIYKWPQDSDGTARYYFIKGRTQKWQLNGIYCPGQSLNIQ